MTPSEGTAWLSTFLALARVPPNEGQRLGSHSLKATLLSWSAKWGMSSDFRRALGQHRKMKDRSVDVYSRDHLAPCLRSLVNMVRDIREGTFRPDMSRSGYIEIQPAVVEVDAVEPHTPTELADSEDSQDSFEKASVSTEASDDSSAQKAHDGVKASLLASALAREEILLINQKSGKVHVKR
eukprot:6461354-Amphidinium_carterae.1